jgi:hypothetical protein
MYQNFTREARKRLPAFFLLLLIGSFSCSKKEASHTNADGAATAAPISVTGNWTAGTLTDSKRSLADTAAAVVTTSHVAGGNWVFQPDGKLTVGAGSASTPMTYTLLSNNRVVLAAGKSVDTFTIASKGTDQLVLTLTKPLEGSILTEVLELHRSF